MMKLVYLFVAAVLFVGGILAILALHGGLAHHEEKVTLDRGRAMISDFLPKSMPLDDAECASLVDLGNRICCRWSSGEVDELVEYVQAVQQLMQERHQTDFEQCKEKLEAVFNRRFLRCRDLVVFRSVQHLDEFLSVNLCIAEFLGNIDVKRNEMEFAKAKEDLAFRALQRYIDYFSGASERELSDVASKHLNKWIERIESESGFARSAATFAFRFDTEFLPATRPECHMTREMALRHARSMAIGLLQCGYRPRWLEDFKDPNGNRDPWDMQER